MAVNAVVAVAAVVIVVVVCGRGKGRRRQLILHDGSVCKKNEKWIMGRRGKSLVVKESTLCTQAI
jgi:hypothetical protein